MDVARVFRAEHGRAVAAVTRFVGDLTLAEDAVQDAFVEALRTWPERGEPANPGAWITTVARRRALDRIRRETARDGKEIAAVRCGDVPGALGDEVPWVRDDELRLLFTCCHPALAPDAQVALTLRLVCGLTTAEIARAFLQTESTVTRRLSRAKAKIRDAGIPFRSPPEHLLPERVPQVTACIYLVFTEGYSATSGDAPVREDLCVEAIRLGRLLCDLMPDQREAWALLALMLLHDSRRHERVGADGAVRPLEEQDRGRWDGDRIRDGLDALDRADGSAGPYLPQAVIAAVHACAPTWNSTDWATIVGAYDRLLELSGSPVVAVNRAVAVGFRDGWEAGLSALEALPDDPRLRRLIEPVRADLLRRAGRWADAADAYRAALETTGNEATARFLRRRLEEVGRSIVRAAGS
ncbi:RNA polymerase sigma factor [Rhodococcus sp. (in: high G+C Gram-positive bacteria)]|uniref:RNA polymerase sigma factor n=1 Tax=Rhodococcus sp. TaxID=1831 RepID=UPI00388FF0B7